MEIYPALLLFTTSIPCIEVKTEPLDDEPICKLYWISKLGITTLVLVQVCPPKLIIKSAPVVAPEGVYPPVPVAMVVVPVTLNIKIPPVLLDNVPACKTAVKPVIPVEIMVCEG